LACLDRLMVERPTPVVMVSSLTEADADATLEAFRLGAVDFVAKPHGAISLYIDELAPELVRKVRAAAGARIRSTLRLSERVRHRIGGTHIPRSRPYLAPDLPLEADGVVLIGVSTGGPPALETLLAELPGNFRWPLVIAQHMPATFTGPLANRLNTRSPLTVSEVRQPVLLQKGCAYIAQGGADIVLARRPAGVVAMSVAPEEGYPWHPSVDRLVRSALDCVPARQLLGVLMTGMGNDGAAAMARMRAEGGRTIAEAEESAVVWGMPGELVAAGGADWIVPLPGIADRLQRLIPYASDP
jgi:two-component system chemotaxis response regulator CheB